MLSLQTHNLSVKKIQGNVGMHSSVEFVLKEQTWRVGEKRNKQ